MSFDIPHSKRRKVAIIGGGISGLATALSLAPFANVTVFEAQNRLGGHARTVLAGRNGDQPVDTGFIVFNYANYPHLTRMFHDLDVPVKKSDMSFGVSVDNGRIEYALRSMDGLFAQRKNMINPKFIGMVRDILRFNANAVRAAVSDEITVDDLIENLNLGRAFRDYYLFPICGAIWSTPPKEIGKFPAKTLLRFLQNHALLSPKGQHQWWTVDGGSIEYLRRLEVRLRALGVELRTNCAVQSVDRGFGAVSIRPYGGEAEIYDEVVFASHPDEALAILSDASATEQKMLGAIEYQDNHVILHADTQQMPRRQAAWASWVYQAKRVDEQTAIGVTYWMNRLQGIDQNDPLFVTLNAQTKVNPALIYDEVTFRHPVFDRAALSAQKQIAKTNGTNQTWFTGAWLRHGFHEDGYASAMRVSSAMMRAYS